MPWIFNEALRGIRCPTDLFSSSISLQAAKGIGRGEFIRLPIAGAGTSDYLQQEEGHHAH
jgi:hypothetical protein